VWWGLLATYSNIIDNYTCRSFQSSTSRRPAEHRKARISQLPAVMPGKIWENLQGELHGAGVTFITTGQTQRVP